MKLPTINKCEPKIFDQNREGFTGTCFVSSVYTAIVNIYGLPKNDADVTSVLELASDRGWEKKLSWYKDQDGVLDGGTYNGIKATVEVMNKKHKDVNVMFRKCSFGDELFKEALSCNLPIITSIRQTHKGYADKSRDGVLNEEDYTDYSKILHQICLVSSDDPRYDRMHYDTFPGDKYYNIYYVEDGYSRTNRYEEVCYVIIPQSEKYNELLLKIEMIENYLNLLKYYENKRWK